MGEVRNITQSRAAARFHQVNVLERQLVTKVREMAACQADLKELKTEYDSLLSRLRMAARDEGELPLFADTDDEEGG